MIDQLIAPLINTAINTIKEIRSAKGSAQQAKKDLETTKTLLRLQVASEVHSLLIGDIVKDLYKGDNARQGLEMIISVAAIYELYTTKIAQSIEGSLKNLKGMKDDDIAKHVEDITSVIKAEADKMTNIIKKATGVS